MQLKSEQGFTLVEVIVSIAILAITSVVVLQLFLGAKTISQRAFALDQSDYLAANAIEVSKGIDDLTKLTEHPFFQEMSFDWSWHLDGRLEAVHVVGRFDEHFQVAKASDSAYVLYLVIEESDEKDPIVAISEDGTPHHAQVLMTMEVAIIDLENNSTVVSYETNRYCLFLY